MISDPQTYLECVNFLNREAELLDEWRLWDWYDTLAEDLTYVAPIRETKESRERSEEFSGETFHFHDDKESIEMRIKKMDHEYSWSHIPPVRDRRFVSNVRVVEVEDSELQVRSNLYVRIGERDKPGAEVTISCERFDTIRSVDGEYRLTTRDIYFDDTAFDTALVLFF